MPSSELACEVLVLTPEYRDYIWGGNRLRPGARTAEAWVIYENNRIASGPLAGRTLAEAAAEHGAALLGRRVVDRTGMRFPVLIKLLDCAAWLSIQVHPNDEQAARLEGPGLFGKTEAWHVLDAAPDAQLIAGLKPGTTAEALVQSIHEGTILNWVQYLSVQAGDTIFIRPGTLHALGPGLLVYEVQQTSDITYRVFDWNRPQTAGRVLHIDKSLAVVDPSVTIQAQHVPHLDDGDRQVLCQSPYFTLETIAAQTRGIELDTQGESFHALTVIEGAAVITTGKASSTVIRFESVVMPAACGKYQIQPVDGLRILKASIEET
jgi:mannose-6-phosphate isomerase